MAHTLIQYSCFIDFIVTLRIIVRTTYRKKDIKKNNFDFTAIFFPSTLFLASDFSW